MIKALSPFPPQVHSLTAPVDISQMFLQREQAVPLTQALVLWGHVAAKGV